MSDRLGPYASAVGTALGYSLLIAVFGVLGVMGEVPMSAMWLFVAMGAASTLAALLLVPYLRRRQARTANPVARARG